MDKEKFDLVLDYFAASEIELPIEVLNSLQDAFEENETIDEVNCYFRNDSDTFANDITLKNTINIHLDGKSDGESYDVYSYYGDPEYILNEHSEIFDDKRTSVNVIVDVQYDEKTSFDADDFVILLLEKHTWNTPEYKTERQLLIYCPKESPDDE